MAAGWQDGVGLGGRVTDRARWARSKANDRPNGLAPEGAAALRHEYHVYGITLRSELALPLPERGDGALAQIELYSMPKDWIEGALRQRGYSEPPKLSWSLHAELRDQTSYARWQGVGEFLVSPSGKSIACRQFTGATGEAFGVYLLGQALSFALVKQGFEPLHATCVDVGRGAIALLGHSGFGKSTLAACFLAGGHPLLTDDLLVWRDKSSAVLAYPGPRRIKMLPRMARRLMPNVADGTPMNRFTRKMVLPLGPHQMCEAAVPLRAIYVITGPRDIPRGSGIRIKELSRREAFYQLLRNTFNDRIVEPSRLKRQLVQTARLARLTPVRRLSYPRAFDRLPGVREAILSDLGGKGGHGRLGADVDERSDSAFE